MACRPCLGLPCTNPSDLASGIDGAFYSALDFSFIVDCPTGCECLPGLFPQVISILASTIPPVIPPIAEPGAPIILRLQGCTSLITRTLDEHATQDEIAAAAQSIQAEWASQQALCIARSMAGVNCNPDDADFITVCNDAQGPLWCGDSVAACLFTQRLQITGLTQTEIDAAVALIKANLNQNALLTACLGWTCPITEQFVTPPGSVDFWVVNVGDDPIDLTGLTFCISFGSFCQGPSIASIPAHSGPTLVRGFSGPFVHYEIRNFGSEIFSGAVSQVSAGPKVTLTVGCNPANP